jgi:hypothetical protein
MTSAESFNVPANTTFTYFGYPRTEQVQCYRVWAFNSAASLPSTSYDCTVTPASPTNLIAEPLDGQTIALNWIDNSSWEDGYKVSRSEQSGVWADIATLAANATNYKDVAASRDVSYTYRVQALKDGGYSDTSNNAIAVIPTSVPAAPREASAAYSRGPDEYPLLYLGIAWIDASSNEAGFRIEYSADGAYWGVWAVTGPNATSFFQWFGLDDDPPAGCFRVIAFNAIGDSPPSNVCSDLSSATTSGSSVQAAEANLAGLKRAPTVLKNRGASTKPIRVQRIPRLAPLMPNMPPIR